MMLVIRKDWVTLRDLKIRAFSKDLCTKSAGEDTVKLGGL